MDDNITNLLVSLKTAYIMHKLFAKVRPGGNNEVILKKLEAAGYICGFERNGSYFLVTLQPGFPITSLKRVSTRGNRKYFSYSRLLRSNTIWGLISTKKGLLTINEALNNGIGGEVLFWVLSF